jgi:hypothetical protein
MTRLATSRLLWRPGAGPSLSLVVEADSNNQSRNSADFEGIPVVRDLAEAVSVISGKRGR